MSNEWKWEYTYRSLNKEMAERDIRSLEELYPDGVFAGHVIDVSVDFLRALLEVVINRDEVRHALRVTRKRLAEYKEAENEDPTA